MEALWANGARIQAYDPEAMHVARQLYGDRPDLLLGADPGEVVEGAHALVICTEWKQFRVVDFDWLKRTLKLPIVVDGRNLYDPAELKRHGFRYYAIGRGQRLASGAGSTSAAVQPSLGSLRSSV